MPSNKTDYMKEYYLKNKEKLKDGSTKKIICECCNKEISYANWNKHIKSRVHLKNQANIQSENNMQDAFKLLQQYKENLDSVLESLKTNQRL